MKLKNRLALWAERPRLPLTEAVDEAALLQVVERGAALRMKARQVLVGVVSRFAEAVKEGNIFFVRLAQLSIHIQVFNQATKESRLLKGSSQFGPGGQKAMDLRIGMLFPDQGLDLLPVKAGPLIFIFANQILGR